MKMYLFMILTLVSSCRSTQPEKTSLGEETTTSPSPTTPLQSQDLRLDMFGDGFLISNTKSETNHSLKLNENGDDGNFQYGDLSFSKVVEEDEFIPDTNVIHFEISTDLNLLEKLWFDEDIPATTLLIPENANVKITMLDDDGNRMLLTKNKNNGVVSKPRNTNPNTNRPIEVNNRNEKRNEFPKNSGVVVNDVNKNTNDQIRGIKNPETGKINRVEFIKAAKKQLLKDRIAFLSSGFLAGGGVTLALLSLYANSKNTNVESVDQVQPRYNIEFVDKTKVYLFTKENEYIGYSHIQGSIDVWGYCIYLNFKNR